MSIESKLKRTSVQLEFRYYSRQKFSSTFKRAILQAHATKFVPSSKVEAFRETVKKSLAAHRLHPPTKAVRP